MMRRRARPAWAANWFVKSGKYLSVVMSRIGKQAIIVPDGVTVEVTEEARQSLVMVKGPKGELSYAAHPDIAVETADGQITCTVKRSGKQSAALWGTTRACLANLIEGVTAGFEKKLELQGVGYKAQLKGADLELSLGYSHSITVPAPEGVTFAVDQEIITVSGIDKVLVGQVAADIRALRKPEPYKGKGVRYVGEHVRRKVGKVVGAAEGGA